MGLYCVIGILLAMHERQQSGKGQAIEVTLYDAALSLMHPHFPNYFLSGKTPQLTGNQHSNLVPYGMYETKTCRIMIGAGNNRAFKKVAEVLGRPELADDPRFRTNGDRQQNRDALNQLLTEKLAEVDGMTFSLELLKSGLPCGPVLDTRQVLEGAHVKARGMVVEKDWYKGIGTPVRLSRTPGSVKSAPPKFSQHAREVLKEHGFDDGANREARGGRRAGREAADVGAIAPAPALSGAYCTVRARRRRNTADRLWRPTPERYRRAGVAGAAVAAGAACVSASGSDSRKLAPLSPPIMKRGVTPFQRRRACAFIRVT